jgi:hypothetical protein
LRCSDGNDDNDDGDDEDDVGFEIEHFVVVAAVVFVVGCF